MQKSNVAVIIPNWNGSEDLPGAIDSILAQSYRNFALVVVDNGSSDSSKDIIESYKQKDDRVRSVYRDKNYGYTGGVNPGFEIAIAEGKTYAAPFNNDARADKDWLKHLVAYMDNHQNCGIATCNLLLGDGKTIDSTGDQYTVWGISFPRGRNEENAGQYNHDTAIFGASGGASIYRVDMLKKVGLFDQDFFAYYEDVDLSFRAQLAGWKVAFVPKAIVYHDQGKTAARLAKRSADDHTPSPFITRQYMKNLPFVLIKDVPFGLLPRILPRFMLAYTIFFANAFVHGRGIGALQGALLFWLKLPKKLWQRRRIQSMRTVSTGYIWDMLVHDLPPNALKLRRLRALWWRVTRRAAS